MDNSTKQIKTGALMSYIAIGVNIVAGLLYTPWMVRNIGQENYGLYILALSIISFFVMDFGIGSAASRYVARLRAQNDRQGISDILGVIYKLYIGIDVIILVILTGLFFYLGDIYRDLTTEELTKFKFIYIVVGIFNLISLPFVSLNGIMQAYEKFIQLKACELFNKIVTVACIVLVLLLGYGLYALVLVNVSVRLLTILIKLLIIRKDIKISVNFRFHSRSLVREIFSFSIYSTVIDIAQRFIFNITPSILGALAGSVSIAVFGVGSSIEGYVYTFASAINGLFLAKVARISIRQAEQKDYLPLMIKVGRIQFLILGIVVVNFIAFGNKFIMLWMGPHFSTSYICALLLIVPSLIASPQQIGNTAIIIENKVKYQAIVFTVMAVLNFFLSLIFTKIWGAVGASLSIFIAYMIRTLGMNILFANQLKMQLKNFYMDCYVKLGIPCFVCLLIGVGVNELYPQVSWISFLGQAAFTSAAYCLIMWLFGLNQYEKNLLLNLKKRS